MHEIGIVQGKVTVVGDVHGAINSRVDHYDDVGGWEFKQFHTMQELYDYAASRHYCVSLGEEQ